MIRVLTVNCYNFGSTGKIIRDIEKQLEKTECQFYHCYEMGNRNKENHSFCLSNALIYRIYYIISRITGRQYSTGLIPALKVIFYVFKYRIDIVHIHCPNAGSINLYVLLKYLKKEKIPTVITNHAEFFYTGNCAHAFDCEKYLTGCGKCPHVKEATNSKIFDRTSWAWKKLKKIYVNNHNIVMVAVSDWQKKRMEQSTLCKDIPIYTIENGTDSESTFYPKDIKRMRHDLLQHYEYIVLHVTAGFSDPDKGGTYIIELAKRLRTRGIRVIVAGPYQPKQLSGFDLPDNLLFLGNIESQKLLADYYSSADITVITSKRETYGMVCAESLCCGTPVVGFDNGGTPSIALEEYSSFVEYGNIDELELKVVEWVGKKQSLNSEWNIAARIHYSSRKMAKKYFEKYCDILIDRGGR